MGETARQRVVAADFALWQERLGGERRWELERGVPVAMAPERLRHVLVKTQVATLLQRAVEQTGSGCRVFGDGVSLHCGEDDVYEPDALVQCEGEIDPDALSLDSPVVVVEVLSPATAERDAGAKLAAYTALPSVRHYLLLDPSRRLLVHHRKVTAEGPIETAIRTSGSLALEPPGLTIDVGACFATLPPARGVESG